MKAALTGEDIIEGVITGAVSGFILGGISDYITNFNAVVLNDVTSHASLLGPGAQAGLYATGGAVSGGINAAIAGGDIGRGVASGFLSSGVTGYFGDTWNPARLLAEGSVGGVVAEINGGEFADGAWFSFGKGSLTYASQWFRNYELNHTPDGTVGNSPGILGLWGKLAGARPVQTSNGSWNYPGFGNIVLGGNQGGIGFNKFLFDKLRIDYGPGSIWDTINESFAGTHDFFNGRIIGMYNYEGFYVGGRFGKSADAFFNLFNVAPAVPFAISTLASHYRIN